MFQPSQVILARGLHVTHMLTWVMTSAPSLSTIKVDVNKILPCKLLCLSIIGTLGDDKALKLIEMCPHSEPWLSSMQRPHHNSIRPIHPPPGKRPFPPSPHYPLSSHRVRPSSHPPRISKLFQIECCNTSLWRGLC